MKISKLALLALLGGALVAFGCSSDSSNGTGGGGGTGGGTGGTGGVGGGGGAGGQGGMATCDAPACIFCPQEALGPQGGVIGDLTVPVDFTATPDQAGVVQGQMAMVAIEASSQVSDLPVSVTATVVGTSTYEVTSGGTGTVDIAIPEQEVMGMDLDIDAGEGTLEMTADAEATEAVIQLTSATFTIDVTEPNLGLQLNLDASEDGECDVLGDGVTLTVDPAQQ